MVVLQLSENDVKEATKRIAKALAESKIQLIRRIIQVRGLDFAEELLAKTLEIEANGGLMVKEGDRRRTPGGVFLLLAKEQLTEEEQQRVFPHMTAVQKRRVGAPQFPIFSWENWPQTVGKTLSKKGKASEVIVQVTGRVDGHIERRKDVVILSVEQRLDNLGSLPYGVPAVPDKLKAVTYTAFIAQWQWAAIEKQVRQPGAQIVIKGYFAYDKDLGTVVIFGTEAKVKAAKQRDKAAADNQPPQKNQRAAGQHAAHKGQREHLPSRAQGRERAAERQPEQPAPASVPASAPASPPAAEVLDSPAAQAAKRLEELRTARATYERNLAESAEGFKAQMTKKVLAQTVAEIQELEGRFPDLAR